MTAGRYRIDVSEETLQNLLSRHAESEDLDYKEQLDFTLPGGRVEFARDIGAMLERGGHIIIGSDSYGNPSGELIPPQAQGFDEARLRDQVKRYISGSFEMSAAFYEHRGLGIIHVLPHRDGCCVFATSGQYVKQHTQRR